MGFWCKMWSNKSYSEYVLSSALTIYSTLIAFVWRNYYAAHLFICSFSFILWWGSWFTNMSPSDKKSLILRWPLRPVGLLFTISRLLILQMPHIIFGKNLPCNSWEDINGRRSSTCRYVTAILSIRHKTLSYSINHSNRSPQGLRCNKSPQWLRWHKNKT